MPCPELLRNDHSPAHAIGGVNHMLSPKLGSRLCCRLPLSWLPVNRSSEGDTQSCCIVIGIALKNCIEGTTPTSWSAVDSRTQPLGPNHGLCCRCRNWRRFSVAMWTSARQTKWKCWSSFPIYTQVLIICGTVVDMYVRMRRCVCVGIMSKLA